MTDKIPPRIKQAFIDAGYTNPKNGEPSVRSLANDLEMNHARISRYFYQGSNMQIEARQAIADALGLTLGEMDTAVQGYQVEPYLPPETAHTLSYRNRRLIDQLINALSETEQKEGDGNAQRAASITQAGDDSPAHDDELARRRDLTQHEIDTLPHVAADPKTDIRPDQDVT